MDTNKETPKKVDSPEVTLESNKEVSKEGQDASTEEIITPTEINPTEVGLEKKRDLSAIIPKFVDNEENANAVELISKDNELKGDGAVSIGTINSEGEITINDGVTLPEQIDVEQRKIEFQKNKTKKREKVKRKNNKAAQKVQNVTAFGSLVVIIALAVVIFLIVKAPSDDDFQPLTVKVELGESLPVKTASYVKPGRGTKVEELLYTLDLSKVNESAVGTYEYTVTFNNIKKTGKVIINDTTPPELEVRELIISEGTPYTAASFISSCYDPSGCNYSFQDAATPTKNTSPGSYVVYVIATDAYNNTTTKKASLIIEAEGNLRTYVREVPYSVSTGCEINETYSLRFRQNQNEHVLIIGSYTKEQKYQNADKYQEARKTYAGDVGYTFDDANMIMKYTESNLTFVGSNYSRLSDIESYLSREGFSYRG